MDLLYLDEDYPYSRFLRLEILTTTKASGVDSDNVDIKSLGTRVSREVEELDREMDHVGRGSSWLTPSFLYGRSRSVKTPSRVQALIESLLDTRLISSVSSREFLCSSYMFRWASLGLRMMNECSFIVGQGPTI